MTAGVTPSTALALSTGEQMSDADALTLIRDACWLAADHCSLLLPSHFSKKTIHLTFVLNFLCLCCVGSSKCLCTVRATVALTTFNMRKGAHSVKDGFDQTAKLVVEPICMQQWQLKKNNPSSC